MFSLYSSPNNSTPLKIELLWVLAICYGCHLSKQKISYYPRRSINETTLNSWNCRTLNSLLPRNIFQWFFLFQPLADCVILPCILRGRRHVTKQAVTRNANLLLNECQNCYRPTLCYLTKSESLRNDFIFMFRKRLFLIFKLSMTKRCINKM